MIPKLGCATVLKVLLETGLLPYFVVSMFSILQLHFVEMYTKTVKTQWILKLVHIITKFLIRMTS